MKRVVSILLALCLLLCCAPVEAVGRAYLRQPGCVHGQTAFCHMALAYPDPEEVLSELDALIQAEDRPEKERIEAFEGLRQAYGQLVGAASLAYVRYCQDVTNEERAAEYGKLNGALYAVQNRLIEAEQRLMDRYGYHRERGEAYRQSLELARKQSGPSMQALKAKEDELCQAYEQLTDTLSVEFEGRKWTFDSLMADESLPLSDFLAALEAYEKTRNQAAGQLFLELMSLRKAMAKELGFPSYAACQYAAFGRAYSPEQAREAAQTVKRVFVPLYADLRTELENEAKYLAGAAFPEDEFLSQMGDAVERAVPGAGAAWAYMLAYGLYDSAPAAHKLQGSFTTYLSGYRCPFLFTRWNEDAASVFTVIHEFGHFLSYYVNPMGTYYGGENLDLAEADAQGLELLMAAEYDAIFGRYATAARLCLLMNALYAVLTGFMEDEFQQRAYALKEPTVEQLNALYGKLAREYGFDRWFGYEGREWTGILHTFAFPFYYVSYGVSMLGAAALMQGGRRAYGRLLHRKAGASLQEVLKADVLSEPYIVDAAAYLRRTAEAWLNK